MGNLSRALVRSHPALLLSSVFVWHREAAAQPPAGWTSTDV